MINKNDYSINDVPINRKGILKYILRNRIWTIMSIFIFSLPFYMPFLFVSTYTRYFLYSYPKTINELLNYVLFKNFLIMIALFILGIGLSGLFYSYRRLLFNKTVKASYHYFKGIKESGFEFGIFTVAIYLLYSIFEYFIHYIFISYKNGNISMFLMIFLLILIVLIIYFLFYLLINMFTSASLYIVSFRQAYIDAFKAIKFNFIKDFAFFVFLFIPILMIIISTLFNIKILFVFSLVFLLLFSFIFGILIMISKIYDKFDELINKYEYKELYKIGLKDYYVKD